MPKRPYYKLSIGKPTRGKTTSTDMRFGCGRLRVEIHDDYPDAAAVLAHIFDLRWNKMLVNMADFVEAHPHDCAMTAPADQPFDVAVEKARAAIASRERKA